MVYCLFCKIIKKEIPAQIVYEDESVMAFLDIKPVNPGHTLLIPKEHFADMDSASGESLRNIVSVAPKIARAIMQALGYEAYIFSTNNGEAAGQEVKHLHFHIIPRAKKDGHLLFAQGTYKEGEMEEIAEQIQKQLK